MSTEKTTNLFSDQPISISDDSHSTSASTLDTKKRDNSATGNQDDGESLIADKAINQTIVNALNAVVAKSNNKVDANTSTDTSNTKVTTDNDTSNTLSAKVAIDSVTHTDNHTTDDNSNDVKQMSVVISGFNYIINCPANERDGLNKAVGYINGFIRELRKNSPALAHENLLVLCCLNLFEEMQQQKNNTASLMETDKQVRSLLEKISSDATSIMG